MRRRTSTLRPLLAAGLLSLLVAMSGCSDAEPTPKFEEPTGSPTPAEVKEETPEAFIKRWALLEKEMQNTGETEAYREMTRGCTACTTLADRVDAIYSAGGQIQAEGKKIVAVSPLGSKQHLVSTSIGPTLYRESAESAEVSMDGGSSEYVLTLDQRDEGFILADIKEQG